MSEDVEAGVIGKKNRQAGGAENRKTAYRQVCQEADKQKQVEKGLKLSFCIKSDSVYICELTFCIHPWWIHHRLFFTVLNEALCLKHDCFIMKMSFHLC